MVLAVSLTACTGGTETEARPCPSPTPLEDLSRLPNDVPLADFGEVVEANVEGGYLTAVAISRTQIIELDPPMQRELLAAGYEILSHDNEGFEAEIFFARGSDTVGTFTLREGPCAGQVTIRLVYGAKRYEERTS